MKRISRRAFTAATVAGLSGLAGCSGLNPFSDPPITLKVYAAEGDETDVKCRLDEGALSDLPTLRRLVKRVADEPPTTRVETGISQEKGDAINQMLIDQCGEEKLGGLYRYQGNWFFIGMTFDTQEGHADHHEGQGTTTEHTH